jgi:hypothetical protein
MDDINSSIGIISHLPEACLPFDYAKIGIVQQLESRECICTVCWNLGKGCNPKSRKNLAVSCQRRSYDIGICVSAALGEATIERSGLVRTRPLWFRMW